MALLDIVKSVTGIETYDASSSEVVVADYPLSDFTKVTVIPSEYAKSETGVDASYHVPISSPTTYTIVVSLLPSSPDGDFLAQLRKFINDEGGYFQISINNSGKFAGTYSVYFTQDTGIDIDIEPEDEQYTFVGVREDLDLLGTKTPEIESKQLTITNQLGS